MLAPDLPPPPVSAPWIVMALGEEQPLAHDATPRYSIETIAHHLAQINRFTGAARRPYSVAEHSVLCADIAEQAGGPRDLQLACLMHDAHEAVVGDVSTPVKQLLGRQWALLETRHARALREAFGLTAAFERWRTEIKTADLVALATERRDLLPWEPDAHRPWPALNGVTRYEGSLTSAWREHMHWSEWQVVFVQRFERLGAAAHPAGQEAAP